QQIFYQRINGINSVQKAQRKSCAFFRQMGTYTQVFGLSSKMSKSYLHKIYKLINTIKKRIGFYFKFYSLIIWQPLNPYCMYICFFPCLNICITISNKYSLIIFHT